MKVWIETGKHSASVATGSYEKDGETKKTYSYIGTLFVKEDGKMSLLITNDILMNILKTCVFGFNFDGWINFFPPKEDGQIDKSTIAIQEQEEIPF